MRILLFSLLSYLAAVAALFLILAPGTTVVVLAQNTTTVDGGDITDDDFVAISDEIPQHVTEIAFPPDYQNPCRSVPKTKFTIRTSDSVEVLSYPADLVVVSVAGAGGSILQIDFRDGLQVVDNTTWTGVIIAFPSNQLKKVGNVERDQHVQIQDGFTGLTNLSQVNNGGLLTATFTQIIATSDEFHPIHGLLASTKGKAIVSSNVGFDTISASTDGTVMVVGNVIKSARADTGGLLVIDGTFLNGNATSTTGSLLLIGRIGKNANVSYNTGGQVETPNCTLVVAKDDTGGGCTESADINLPIDVNSTTAEDSVYVTQGYIPCCSWWNLWNCPGGPLAGVADGIIPSSHAVAVASMIHNTIMMMAGTTIMTLLCL